MVRFYWCVARPTILANRFVAAVNNRDFRAARDLLPDFWLFDGRPNAPRPDMVYAEVFPREWTDLHMFQRRIIVRIGRHYDNQGQHVEWTEDSDIVVRPQGLEVETPASVNVPLPGNKPMTIPSVDHLNGNIYLEGNPRTG